MAGRKKAPGAGEPPESVRPRNVAGSRGDSSGARLEGKHGRPVAIVGIGASAGGLEALKAFLSSVEPESGLAFVLIPHLDPGHKSMMAELLSRSASVAVTEAKDGERIAPNRVYVIPPNRDLQIEGGRLHLSMPVERHRSTTAIDGCLRSLARDQKERAIGIILSGTGSHGVLGLRELKVVGGMVMAQDPATAEYDAMPRNAIATGLVDYVLAPGDMPAALMRYIHHSHLHGSPARAGADESELLKRVVALVRARTKHDFRSYRRSMLSRRILRRMGLLHVDDPDDYLELLRGDSAEVTALCKDLLIGVTAFFREPAAFDVLQQRVLPDMVSAHTADGPVRVWVPGCATGEEAYSVAMIVIEAFLAAGRPAEVQVFATDVDETALETGRQGLYPETIERDVARERLERFFVRQGDSYQVSKQLRETVIFASQNLISDAPFTRLDLVSCRNVLIYLDPEVQQKVITLFHFALREGGVLLLGPSESVGPLIDMYEPVSRKWRVFRRTGPIRRELIEIPILASRDHPRARTTTMPASAPLPVRYAELTQKLLLATFAPAAVLINRRYEILYFYGPTSQYLDLPTGEPTRDLVLMVRQGLRTRVRSTCQQALREGRTVIDQEARVQRNGAYLPCTITVQPIDDRDESNVLLLVVFEDRPAPEMPVAGAVLHDESAIVRQLEYELKVTSEDLRSTIEELESSNEELKASNEEVMSMNEELQSANEELETSKEELQSLNEELSTVNSQLQDKIEQLENVNNDITNLLHSTDIATTFLDRSLRIKRFTPSVAALFGMRVNDIGRPLADLAPRISDDSLIRDCERVLERLTPIEREVRARDGHYFLRRVLPYRTSDSRIDGVVIAWINIDERRRSEGRDLLLNAVLQNTSDAVVIHDVDGRILAWNRGAERLYGYTESGALTMNIRDLVPPERRREEESILSRAARGATIEDFETQRITADRRVLDVSVTMTRLPGSGGQGGGIASTERDITELRIAAARKQEAGRLRRLVEHLPAGAVYIEGDHLEMNRAAEDITGYARTDVSSVDDWFAALHGEDSMIRSLFSDDRATGYPLTRTVEITRRDGVRRTVEFAGYGFEHGHIWVLHDVTERQRAEAGLRDREARLRAIFDTAIDAIITIRADGGIESINRSGERMFGWTEAELRGRQTGTLLSELRDQSPREYVTGAVPGADGVIAAGNEMTGYRSDGRTFPAEVAMSEVADPERRFFTAFVRDVSARRQLESRMARIALDERYSLARDLHDGLGSQLAAVAMLAEALRRSLERRETEPAPKAAELAQSIQSSREQLRRIAHGLLPLEIAEHGLPGALEELADQVERMHGISCACDYDEQIRIQDPAAAAQLFRIAQEAVNNAVQHARPQHVWVTVHAEGNGFILRIADDGGQPDSDLSRPGHGIAIMKERARLLNGVLDIRARPEGGTVVTLSCATIPGDGNDALP